MVNCYTDGATSNNGKENAYGGYGAIILRYDNNDNLINKSEIFGPITGDKVTNNVSELTAVLMAIKSVLGSFNEVSRNFEEINIYTDSAYIANCFKEGWYKKWQMNGWVNSKKKPVENRELWEEIITLVDFSNINFYKVKGHAGIEFNEIADGLARKGVEIARKN